MRFGNRWSLPVNIFKRECACKRQISGIPCVNTIAALHDRKLELNDYIGKGFQKDTYMKAHTSMIYLITAYITQNYKAMPPCRKMSAGLKM